MIDPKHPRAKSLAIRDLVVEGVEKGITSKHGLIAQGRGEAFDYLIGEKTQSFAEKAIGAAAAQLLLADHPVLSINGNIAALVPQKYADLAAVLNCPIEINLFHASYERKEKIKNHLLSFGAKNILGVDGTLVSFKEIASSRKNVSPEGIAKADVVLVPLEDGDRTESLVKMGKKVITIDLNPLSRTAQKADITIVDNVVRAMPMLIARILEFKKTKPDLSKIINDYNNQQVLSEAIIWIRQA